MAKSLLVISRTWHRRVASTLFIFFMVITVTGLLLGWKSLFTKTVFSDPGIHASVKTNNWLPLDSLEHMAMRSLKLNVQVDPKQAERIELRPAKGFINFSFKNNYYVQVDGATGNTILIQQKNGSLIQDIHDGAILDSVFTNKAGVSKKTYTTILSLSLLFLTLSGFYLWNKPRQLKKSKTNQ